MKVWQALLLVIANMVLYVWLTDDLPFWRSGLALLVAYASGDLLSAVISRIELVAFKRTKTVYTKADGGAIGEDAD